MGYLKSWATSIVWICTALTAITYIPGLPPHVDFSEYEFKLPVGINKEPNDRLNGAEKLFEGEIKGPEAFDSYNGVLYTTMHGGAVSKLVGNKLVEVVKFGQKCDGIWEEEKCGRPLGLRFDKQGKLYVVDSYYGIFKVDVNTGKYEKIIDISIPIEGKIPMLPNSIEVAANGDLFWTVSSSDYKLYDGLVSMFLNPSGRLIHYNAATKQNVVLLDNLGFANGLKLSDDESFVIVSETATSRLTKYHLKGPQAGKSEIFVESLPGLPDNIESDGQGNFLVSLITSVDEEHPLILQSLAPHPYLRKMIVRTITLLETPFKFLEQSYPNYYSKRIIHWLGHFESAAYLFTPNITILRINPAGKVLDILNASDEKLSSISSAYPFNGYLYLGSPYNEYLARVPLVQALPDLKISSKSNAKVVEQTPMPKIQEQPTPRPVEVPITTERPPQQQPTTAKPVVAAPPSPPPSMAPPPPPAQAQAPKVVDPVQVPVKKEVPVVPKTTEKPAVIVEKPVEKPVVQPKVVPEQKKQMPRDEM